MSKHISRATVISCVALFFSLGGASLAASHYLITSVHQISPKVRRELKADSTYAVASVAHLSVAVDPAAYVVATCRHGWHVETGGFNSAGAIVTDDYSVGRSWAVKGHLVEASPEDTSGIGYVEAWAECAR